VSLRSSGIEISRNDSRPDRIHVTSRFFGSVEALRTRQQVFFKDGEFGFVLHNAKVEAFKILVGNVVHALIVDGAAKSSQISSTSVRGAVFTGLRSSVVLYAVVDGSHPFPS
jgi:hypothetical protein